MISLNEEQMNLLRKEIKLEYPHFNETLIENKINKFLQGIEPILLPNLDEYLHNKPLSKIEFIGFDIKIPITLHDVLQKWTGYDSDLDAYKTDCMMEAFRLFSKYYRKEIYFYTLWHYCRP